MKVSVCIEMKWTEEQFLSQRWTFIEKMLKHWKRQKETSERNAAMAANRRS